MRPIHSVLSCVAFLLTACVAFWGCRQSSRSPHPARPERGSKQVTQGTPKPAAPPYVHDRTGVAEAVQVADGTVWGFNSRSLVRWTDGGWQKVEDVGPVQTPVSALAVDPSRTETVVSLWSESPQTGSDWRWRHHLYRHAPGREREALASLTNPIADENSSGYTPSLAVDAAGDAWLAMPPGFLLRVPVGGGEPRRIDLPREWFEPVSGANPEWWLPLRLTLEPGAAGVGWLWSVIGDEDPSLGGGALFRPARLDAGRIESLPSLKGLPAEGRVTCVVNTGAGRSVWALEGGGLWDIDLKAARATPRSSPPGAWRILDWARPADGLEVALVISPHRAVDLLVGNVWIRRDDVWRDAGPSGDVRASTLGLKQRGMEIRPRSWAVADGVLLGANFDAGLVAIDLRTAQPRACNLGWRQGVFTGPPGDLFTLPDGRVLVLGEYSSAATGEVWRAALRREGEEPRTPIFLLRRNPIRAPDGRIWEFHREGRGAPLVRYWDGERWHIWSLPSGSARWPEEGLHVEVATGRVMVVEGDPTKPAWERDDTVDGGWRRFDSELVLAAARADSGEPAVFFHRWREGSWRRRIHGPKGRVLIGWSNWIEGKGWTSGLWLRREGQWRMFTNEEIDGAPWRYGFDEAGEPWYATVQHERHRIRADGSISKAEPWRDPRERRSSSDDPNRPEWLEAWRSERQAGATRLDETGVWWIHTADELWSAREGEFVRVLAAEDFSPFRDGFRFSPDEIVVDARRNRLFRDYEDKTVLLPALPVEDVRVEWESVTAEADRVGRIVGGRRPEWRFAGGEWHAAPAGRIELRELAPGEHRLEVRAEDARLCPLPAKALTVTVGYDVGARIARLVVSLADETARAEAVVRLGRIGVAAEPRLRAALATETDEERRWWLRSALQAIADERPKALP